MTDDTTPNFRARLNEIAAATDPWVDRALLKVVASGHSLFWLVGYSVLLIVLGIVVR